MPEAAKLMALSTMLKGLALDYYYSNVSTRGLALNFVQACVLISAYFEGAEYKRGVLAKWNAISLRSVMATPEHQGKPMHECLQLLIKELRHLQHDLDGEFRTDKFIHNKLITACQDVPACQYACFKPSDTLADFINDLRSSITTFNKSHPHQAENYQPEAYYTDRRYRTSYSRRQPQYRPRSRSNSDQPRTPYDRGKDNPDRAMIPYKQRCFICNKVGC